MSRGSFGRTVARAAASGGSKNYRARPPFLWYLGMVAIVVVGLGLVVYSRNEALHPASKRAAAEAPTTKDNWFVALGFDVCGKPQPDLVANTNLKTAGIRTFGSGVVNVNPGQVTDSSKFTGAKATLGNFVRTYGHGLTLTQHSLRLPGSRAWTDGDRCPASSPTPGKGEVRVMVWSSPTGAGSAYTGDPGDLRLENGQMITVAFAPADATLPQPRARSILEQDLKGSG